MQVSTYFGLNKVSEFCTSDFPCQTDVSGLIVFSVLFANMKVLMFPNPLHFNIFLSMPKKQSSENSAAV